MAREIHERENLLRDATALGQRVELKIFADEESSLSPPDTLFAGFRTHGEMSLYFDNDPVYQFTHDGLLRRAFCHGQIMKAQQGQLISWQRHRIDQRVEMIPHALDSSEQCRWIADMRQRLIALQQILETHAYQLVGQVPADEDAVDRLHHWLVAHQVIEVADAPGLRIEG